MSDFDTMRWGDTQTIQLVNASELTETGFSVYRTSQMLNAKWQRPLLWKLMLSVAPVIDAADAGAGLLLDVLVSLFVGVGQANAQIPLATFAFTNATIPPYAGQVLFYDIPAEAIQVQFTAATSIAIPSTSTSYISVSAFAAPFTEPRVLTDIRELTRRDRPIPDRDEPDNSGGQRWMGPGFNDGQMRYRK